ncbi:hypothetical protein [Prosthecobacter sp.]|uniref:hypothetical protein n=1 Tax=Prosthecobacter sp. TaxID=1965333 RepID=UPI003784ADF4
MSIAERDDAERQQAPTPPPSIKERSVQLLARYSTLKSKKDAIEAPFKAQIAIINEAVATETTPIQLEMDAIKAEAERIGLANAAEIFGEHCTSVIASGHALKLSESEAVACDDEAATIKRLLKEAGKAHIVIDPDEKAEGAEHRMAASACLRIKVELNKAYIGSMIDDFPEWFQARGISMEPSRTVKLGEAPKPRVPKPKKEKGSKKTAAEAQPEQEAA